MAKSGNKQKSPQKVSPQVEQRTSFDKLYTALNEPQRLAVDTIEGPVMVIAGPGTGKTTVLTLRIANILRTTDTPASAILAITYTDAGVKAMRMKLREIIGPRADEVRIYTFHSFASAIIGEFQDHFVHLDMAEQMTDVEAESLVRSILEDQGDSPSIALTPLRPLGNPEFYIRHIISAISTAKREAQTPDSIRAYAEKEITRIKNDEESISTRGATKGQLKAEAVKAIEKCEKTIVLAAVYEQYEAQKRAQKKMDFDDLILELLAALRNDETLLRLIQEKFLYLLVDEHQDTNDSQNLLILTLADFFETPNVFIVGDEKQAIFRFQGASVENFLKFQKLWKSMKVIFLENNYRSHQQILDASFALIEHNYAEGEHDTLRLKLKAHGTNEKRPIDIVSAQDAQGLDAELISELRSIISKDPLATVAIITRRNREVGHLIQLLENARIPASSERSVDIFNHPAGTVFFDLVQFLADPTRTDCLAKTIIAGMWNLTFDQGLELIAALRSGRTQTISKLMPEMMQIRKNMMSDNTIGFLIDIASQSGYTRLVARDPAYVEVWRAIVALAESIAHSGTVAGPQELLHTLLEYRLAAESRNIKIKSGGPHLPIQILTAHGSKGLEFDYVFIMYASEETWIGRTRGSYFILPGQNKSEGDDIRDARRLFYVALTRAKKHVSILVAAQEGSRAQLPVRFIAELDQTQIALRNITSAENIPAKIESREHNNPLSVVQVKSVDHAKRMLVEKGLSVTALNHFLACPSQFLYKSVFKFPEPPAAAAEKGNALHKAFAQIWKSEDKGITTIEQILRRTIIAYFIDSFLPQFEKKAILAELEKHIPTIARALQDHFAIQGTIYAETWSETSIQLKYLDQTINISLHGKLDAILSTEKDAYVFDYKSREKMSEAQIKGETKNSDGNYFRQLVFYRVLLEADSRFKEKTIIPALVFMMPDDKGRCPTISLAVETTDIERVKDNIQDLIDSVWSGRIVTDTCGDTDCEWCRLKEISQK